MADAMSLVIEELEHGLREFADYRALEGMQALSHDEGRALGHVLARYVNKFLAARQGAASEDAVEVLVDAFRLELLEIVDKSPDIAREFSKVGPLELSVGVKTAAHDVLAPLIWSASVGARWDTTRAAEFLDVTRQALHKRVHSGSILGLPGERTTWFPVWQFDPSARSLRPEVKGILAAFRENLGADVDPFIIAAWALTPQPEDLDGVSPAEWLEGAPIATERVVVAADRAASRLAQ